MSFTSSPELVEASLAACCSGIDASGPSSSILIDRKCYFNGNETAPFLASQSSATSELSTLDPTEDALTSWLEGFPVKPTAAHLEDARWLTISGRKCAGSWQMSLPGTYLPRTSNARRLTTRQKTSSRWVTPSDALPYQRQTWVRTIFGPDIGYLHTPTCTANYAAPSMQKWPSARAFVQVFGKPSPENHEWLMGWPNGWSASKPLAMDKFHSWLQQHGKS